MPAPAAPTVSVFSDHVCRLGEGPCWHPARKVVFWVDILGQALLFRDGKGTTQGVELPFLPSLALPADDDHLLIAGTRGLVRYALDGGGLEGVMAYWAPAGTRTNDGRVHPSGALWLSTMGLAAETGVGAIWWLRDGDLRPILPGLTIPNAIAFSPDGRVGYFADSPKRTIFRVELDAATGLPSGRAVPFVHVEEGVPDGAVVDRYGLLWNVRWGGGTLDAYAPEDGRRVASVSLPAKRCTCPAFVGAGLDAMVVTSASDGYDAAALAADPDAGRTFGIDGGFAGCPEPLPRP